MKLLNPAALERRFSRRALDPSFDVFLYGSAWWVT